MASLKYRPADHAVACPLGDGLALLEAGGGTYYTLDSVGAFIWNLLGTAGCTEDEVAASVATEFEVDIARAAQDVSSLIAELRKAKLVVLGA